MCVNNNQAYDSSIFLPLIDTNLPNGTVCTLTNVFVRGNLWLIQTTFLWRENYIFRVGNILYWRHIYDIISFLSPCVWLLRVILLPIFYLASIVSKDALPQLVRCYVYRWFHNHNKANLRYMFHNILSVSAYFFYYAVQLLEKINAIGILDKNSAESALKNNVNSD